MRTIFAYLFALSVVGCASSPSIQPTASSKSPFDSAVYPGEQATLSTNTSGAEEYRVFRQGATGFVPLEAVREDSERGMTDFCARKGKAPQPLRERVSVPPHVLGNFPRVEIAFACIDKTVAAAPTASTADAKYARLATLKKLLDDRAITQQEFDVEKAKVLAGP